MTESDVSARVKARRRKQRRDKLWSQGKESTLNPHAPVFVPFAHVVEAFVEEYPIPTPLALPAALDTDAKAPADIFSTLGARELRLMYLYYQRFDSVQCQQVTRALRTVDQTQWILPPLPEVSPAQWTQTAVMAMPGCPLPTKMHLANIIPEEWAPAVRCLKSYLRHYRYGPLIVLDMMVFAETLMRLQRAFRETK